MDERKPTIGELAKDIRGDQTQAEFAKQLGITQAHLSQIEAGKKTPGKKVAKRLGEISGLDAGTFIE